MRAGGGAGCRFHAAEQGVHCRLVEPLAGPHAAVARESREHRVEHVTPDYERLDHSSQVVALIRRDIAERRLARQ